MEQWNASARPTRVRIVTIACATALGMTLTASPGRPARAEPITIVVPAVPGNIEVSAENKAFLVGHAVGTQNYVCARSGAGVKYALFTPEATLFDDDDKQIGTHYFSPNPFEPNTNPALVADGLIRATWQHKDTSTVWGSAAPVDGGDASSDPQFVAENAIAWLKVKVVGAQVGPTGGGKLAPTTYIQRLNTQGGVPPPTGCDSLDDLGNQAFVPYAADYFFYKLK